MTWYKQYLLTQENMRLWEQLVLLVFSYWCVSTSSCQPLFVNRVRVAAMWCTLHNAHLSMCNPMPRNAGIYARHRFFVLHPTRQLANKGGGGGWDVSYVWGGAKPRAAPPPHLRQVLKRAKLSLGRGNPPKGGRIWNINRWQMLYHIYDS